MSAQGWEVRHSNSRKLPYFYNSQTGVSMWEAPPGLTQDQIYALPGAKEFLPPRTAPGAPQGAPPAKDGGKPGEVKASHILAKHAGSRRPSSWRQEKITRSLPQARQEIANYIIHLKSLPPDQLPQAFAEIASTQSDCSSARTGGNLGWFGRGQMQKSFEHIVITTGL
ncbi:hypothetical protein M231_05170 [Tremella mesenterica]|uniref:Peptidyl-prolyl cis-trans isomerase n=1 Tax=Tremella mesenterica TaxID=5217 RepID=A0A4Q1BIU5_TREME|nr:hypothetical protein M231_05170 [Tremella mesenterica]